MKNHKVKLLDERGDNELTANHQPERAGLGKVAAFFGLGSLIDTTFSLVTAATEDILAETYFPTSTVLIADTLPAFLVSLIVPYFMQRIPYFGRIARLSAKCQCIHHACTRKTTLLETHWSSDDFICS